MIEVQSSSQPLFKDEYFAFQQLQDAFGKICRENSRQPVCVWYAQEDLQFFRLISNAGYSPPVPMP